MSSTPASRTATPATFRTFAPPAPETPAYASANPEDLGERQEQAIDGDLPNPQVFDILPALHELLSRLLASGPAPPASHPLPAEVAPLENGEAVASSSAIQQIAGQPVASQSTQAPSQSQNETDTDTQTESQTQSQLQSQVNGATTGMSMGMGMSMAAAAVATQTGQYATLQPTYPNQSPLPIQNLAAEVSTIRNMIRRARDATAALPDVERSVEDQEQEIEYLKGEVGRLREVLNGLGVEQEAS